MTNTPPNDTLRAVTVPPDTVASRESAVVSMPPEQLRPTVDALASALQRVPVGEVTTRALIDALMLQMGAIADEVAEIREQTAKHDRVSSIDVTVNVATAKSDPPPPSSWRTMPRRWRITARVLGYVVAAAVSAALAHFVPQVLTTPPQPEKVPQNPE